MKTMNNSRRSFLKISSLLTIGVALTPVTALFSNQYSSQNHSDVSLQRNELSARSDIRSLDFDSHNFLFNFRD